MVKILAALVAALSILNSSGDSPGATEKVAALVAHATCSGASHSSVYNTIENNTKYIQQQKNIIIICSACMQFSWVRQLPHATTVVVRRCCLVMVFEKPEVIDKTG